MAESVDAALKDSAFLARDRHTIQVDYVSYMDELADLIGCKPDLWKLWRHQWMLATQVTFGPAVPFQYRLEGPGKWEGALEAVGEACAGYDFRKVVSGGKIWCARTDPLLQVGYQAVAKLREEAPKGDAES
ncbi:Cyclopentanone 1,2-monooxygenase (CPMO) [Irineochytrium annulatum]|nr:Cyclopentanone 1,2-monooxygenase (CPMO) [Irineochytrium annulatum]